MSLSTIQKRLFAWGIGKANAMNVHDIPLIDCPEYHNFGELKEELLGHLRGTVLEIGPGAGANFLYYSSDINWIGIEPNIYMHPYLEQQAQKQGLFSPKLYQGTAENLPVEDESVDTVVSTHVLCSVTDLDLTLKEVKRVLKPDGHFVFIEHVAGECCTWTRTLQNIIEPLWKRLFDNCHPNRETGNFFAEIGMTKINYYQFQVAFPIVSPHIAGILGKSNK